jgi:hypothetical protein
MTVHFTIEEQEIVDVLEEIVRNPDAGAQARLSAIRQLRMLREALPHAPEEATGDQLAALDPLEPRRRARGRGK